MLNDTQLPVRDLPQPLGTSTCAVLSPAQMRLWVLQTLEPESHAYNEVSALSLDGRLDVDALERSVNEIVRRHEILRTTFPVVGRQPVQRINHVPYVPLVAVDLLSYSEREQQSELARLMDSAASHTFNLADGPLLHVSLIRLRADAHVLLIAAHHIVLDGWSTRIFLAELGALYSGFHAGRGSPLSPLPIQYADFATWQQTHVTDDSLATDLGYWTDTLRDLPAPLVLPIAKPEASGLRGGRRRYFDFDRQTAMRLRTFARREGVSPFMVLLATFQTLLFRYTQQTDIIVGGPVANRGRAELEPLIGFFVNTLVFRGDLAGNPTFRELLRRTKDGALAAFDHQELPFERVVEALRPNRTAGRQPLAQTIFSYQSTPVQTTEVAGLTIAPLRVESVEVKYELLLSVGDGRLGLSGYWEYDRSRFEDDAIDRMTDQFRTLLDAAMDAPERTIADLPILPARERQLVLHDWNRTEAPCPQACIHELVEAQAVRVPDAPAVTCGATTLTYHQLDRRASRLAARLQDLGVGPDVLVGIHASRSVEMIVGILATLKAGGAYVPLDPSYPHERLALVLNDADPAVLLVHGDVDLAPSATRAVQVRLDDDVDPPETRERRREVSVTPDDLAYVIYTSGSNGRPNGVMVTHRNLVQSTAARERFYDESPTSFLLLSSLSFDSSVAGIFWALTSGGHLVIPGDTERFDVREVCRLIQCERVSHLLCIPSVYDTLLREAQPYNLDRLRTVIVAGEPCRSSLVERHHWLGWNVRLVNEYGPTEATVWSCAYDCKKNDERARVPIGRPIANTQTFILDEHLQPLPIGVPGELCIGGAGVARGYLDRPELTDARFIPHPFDASPGARLYRTGDLARYLAHGNIELVGRVDDQVKIRGYRLELGDVTAALESHPSVREASAAVRETTTGDTQLLGYIVEERPVSDAELLSHARARLPEFGVPAELVRLDRLPRLPNGKLDRRALVGAVSVTTVPSESAPGRPWTDLESQIRGIWRDVLGKDVGRQSDNFFQVGGDSLSVIRVHNRLRSITDRDVAITDLFKAPTIELQAALVASAAMSGEV